LAFQSTSTSVMRARSRRLAISRARYSVDRAAAGHEADLLAQEIARRVDVILGARIDHGRVRR